MPENFWIQFNNGKKEQLGETKQGVRREQLDKKFHNLFDMYDFNQNGTLEQEELDGISADLSYHAGSDKVLDANENSKVQSIFSFFCGVEDADFMGFVKSVSKASSEITNIQESSTQDGGKKVVTMYSDGATETIEYYSDGEFKYKKTELPVYTLTINGISKEVTKAEYDKALKTIQSGGKGSSKAEYDKLINEFSSYAKQYAEEHPYVAEDGKFNWSPLSVGTGNDRGVAFQVKKVSQKPLTVYIQGHPQNMDWKNPRFEVSQNMDPKPDYVLSERGKNDATVKNFVLNHFVESHEATRAALDTMDLWGHAGAGINTALGESWNFIKNKFNGMSAIFAKEYDNIPDTVKSNPNQLFAYLLTKHLISPEIKEEEFVNFYEMAEKFEASEGRALSAKSFLNLLQVNPDQYFDTFDVKYNANTHKNFDVEEGQSFAQLTEQYQVATVLKQRIACLQKAAKEIKQYKYDQESLIHTPAQNEGTIPVTHILNAYDLLVQYCDGDKEAANMLLDGAITNSDVVAKTISELAELTEKQFKSVLGYKEGEEEYLDERMDTHVKRVVLDKGKSYEQIKSEYESEYKKMYGVDFVPSEMDESVMNAQATGGMVKIGVITIISMLIARSPVVAQIMGAAAGSAEATGAAANLVRGLVAKYGQTAVSQSIRFLMTTSTVVTDVGLTLLGQITDNRPGIQGEEVWESAKSSAKYIYFGAYLGSPLAQAVAKKVGSIGLTGKVFAGGTKTAQGAIETTTISGENFVSNLMKAGNGILAKGSSFATDVGAFSLLELATGADDVGGVFEEQGKMLGKLKIMNKFLEYMLG